MESFYRLGTALKLLELCRISTKIHRGNKMQANTCTIAENMLYCIYKKFGGVHILLSPCGIDCVACPYAESCGGCHSIAGKPFYLKDFGVETCPLYECPVSKKGYKTCGECSELPCETYHGWRDPSMTDEQHQASIDQRVKILKG